MVRRLLADDPAQVVWLAPVDGGPLAPRAASDSRSESPTMGFRPETLPEDAFRPLIDWIDYVLDHEKAPLQAWVQAAQFDFEAFICDEDFAAKPKKPPAPPEPKRRKKKGGDDGIETPSVPVIEYVDKSRRQGEETEEEMFTIEKVAPSELQRRRAELEERFTSLEGGLDAPERQALWPHAGGGERRARRVRGGRYLLAQRAVEPGECVGGGGVAVVRRRGRGGAAGGRLTQPLLGLAHLDGLRQGP